MTLNTEELDEDIRTAVRYAMSGTGDDVRSDMQEEIAQELWYEVLTRPANQRRFEECSRHERVNMLKRSAAHTFAKILNADRISNADILVSIEDVKDSLKGAAPSPFIAKLVEIARLELARKGSPYAEAIDSRYVDWVVPLSKSGQNALVRAHVAVTDEANAVYRRMHSESGVYYEGVETAFPTLDDGPKKGSSVDPSARKRSGGYNDPTGEAAVALAMNPSGRELFYDVTPLAAVVAGQSFQPSVPVPGEPYRIRRYWKG